MSPAELLKYVQSFRFGDVKVELRGKDKWCVLLYGYVLNNKNKWEYEPSPSSRGDDFINRTRYNLETAVELARTANERNMLELSEIEEKEKKRKKNGTG